MKNTGKTVIYESLGTWKCTGESNYNSYIMDARLIYNLGSDLKEAIEIVKRNFGDNYTVIRKGGKVC